MIERIYIKNFRSIKEITIDPQGLCALIGANSTGKTNVLRALETLLGETYPTERAFTKDDFYGRDSNATITIQVWFKEPLNRCKLKSCSTNATESCSPASFKLTHTKDENISFGATKFLVLDESGNEYWGSGAARDQVCFVYIPSDRSLERQMTVSQWTLLGKILRKIDENFRKKNSSQDISLEEQFRSAMEHPRSILESDFDDKLDYKKFKAVFTEICKDYAKGLAHGFSLDLEIYDPLFYYKTIQIIGKEDMGSFNVSELGSGVQNLVLLSLFRTYAKIMKNKVVFAIEEPEIYLYPQAQRQLFKCFLALSYPEEGEGTQIFYTTHNPNFVDASRANEVELLRKKEDGTYKLEKNSAITADSLRADRFKIYTHFNTERNELFFARKTVLVEGDSDKILVHTLCERWGIDLDKEGISVISCGGKTGVLYFVGVCRLLGIEDFFAMWDEDDDGEQAVDSHGNLAYALTSGHGLQIEGNLEIFLKSKFPASNFRSKHKVEDAYTWASSVSVEQIPTEFEDIKNFLLPPTVDAGGSTEIAAQEQPAEVVAAFHYDSDIKVEDLPF
ncbi:AAA family ATPase [Candidatus Peribacteria bacterium]|nr:MAG: AAA family ATPase [Candidatus Peribacteria bacterium]